MPPLLVLLLLFRPALAPSIRIATHLVPDGYLSPGPAPSPASQAASGIWQLRRAAVPHPGQPDWRQAWHVPIPGVAERGPGTVRGGILRPLRPGGPMRPPRMPPEAAVGTFGGFGEQMSSAVETERSLRTPRTGTQRPAATGGASP
jgi:hypothetical protein